MEYKFEAELRERAGRFVEALAAAGIKAAIVPGSFRDYMVKVSISRSGRTFGQVNLYYSPKKQQFSLKTHELKEKSIVPDLEACWARPAAIGDLSGTGMPDAADYQAYVDGSYLNGGIGYGVVVLQGDNPIAELSSPVEDESLLGMRQVGGELQAVYVTVEWCQANGIQDVTIYYDYEGIEKWATGAWRAKNPATQTYAAQMRDLQLAIRWQKVQSHSGNRWNERADELAKQGARASMEEPGTEPVQDPLAALDARVAGFVPFLQEREIDSTYHGIHNNQFARVAVAPVGYLDVYHTRKRLPSQPYLHGFRDQALRQNVEDLWQAYYQGQESEPDHKETWLEEVTYYYEILKPYRDCAFDFDDLARALNRAHRHLQRPGIDIESVRYDFDALETMYHNFLGGTTS